MSKSVESKTTAENSLGTQKMSAKVWSESMKRLNGKQNLPLFPLDPKFKNLEIFHTGQFNPDRSIDLNICRTGKCDTDFKSGILFTVEQFLFCRENGGRVVKITYIQGMDGKTAGAIEMHESTREELEDLFKTMKNCCTQEMILSHTEY